MSFNVLVVDDNRELVDLLTSLFEGAGYNVQGAQKGRQATEVGKATPPDLAVIDVLLPDMMGYHVAESLRAANPNLPLLFMSGVFKGARHSGEASTRFPGSQYFEKPFNAKQLLETVQKILPIAAAAPSATPAQPEQAESYDVELDIDVEVEDEEQDPMELTGRIKVTGGGDLTAELRGANLTAARPQKGAVGDRPLVRTTRAEPAPVAAAPAPATAAEGGKRASRTGALTNNLPGLITAFYIARETGELYVQKGKVKKVVYFEEGQPVFAQSNLAADRFGQFLVRVGKIKPEVLVEVVAQSERDKRRTGDILIERGLLRDTERLYFVGQQVKSIIYSLFGWEEGQFVVTFKEKARGEAIKLDVFPGNIIVRGVKKLYKPERLSRLIPPEERLIPGQQPPYQLNEIDLEKWEAELLPKVDGTRTNAEIIAAAGRPEHVVRGFLAAMVGVQVLERRES